ncbi:MAG: hypothetical protein J0I06_05605 [Planctomycetes bacterium]|nr:hypothetical protein [Planctomycetota bacterium]
MLKDAVPERFIAKSPMAVAVRGALEYALAPADLDDLFVRTVGDGDDRELLFATCVDLMATVVCRVKPSVHAACRAEDHLPVNVTAAYARRARVPATAGRDRVRHTAQRLEPVIRAMGGAEPDPRLGYRVKVLDGNHRGKTQRRRKPLRDVVAGPLPGPAPVVLDPALGLAIDVVPCEDGHAQERSRLGPVLSTVVENDVWVADRNFCATGFLFGGAGRKGFFVIRRHAATPSRERESDRAEVGRTGTGTLSEA